MNPEQAKFLAWVKELVNAMTEEQRLALFSNYCTHCGSDDPKCVCMKDE